MNDLTGDMDDDIDNFNEAVEEFEDTQDALDEERKIEEMQYGLTPYEQLQNDLSDLDDSLQMA